MPPATTSHEVRPSITAGTAPIRPRRGRPPTLFHSAVISYLISNLTPRITRRPAPLREDEILRVGGRVHALVRLRSPLAHLAPPAPEELAFNPRHASRHRLSPMAGPPPRPAALRSCCFAIRRARSFNQQNFQIAPAI